LSIIELKKFCSENLPLYMVPDIFCSLESLPKTSTDKIDYQKLKTITWGGPPKRQIGLVEDEELIAAVFI
jgi:acyl-CoA synthetase (AMP-forming)/AMP-acid ligase II